jgi:hypothetical protein
MAGPPGGPPPLPPLTPEQAAETNLPMLMGVTSAFHVLALVFVACRLYTRFILVKAPKWDDYTMIVAAAGAFSTGMVMFILEAQNGLGRHRQTMSDQQYLDFRKYNWIYSVVCSVISFSTLKVSIALSLLRLSRIRWYTITLWSLIGFIIAYTIVALGSFFFHCKPMEGSFNQSIHAKCYSIQLFVAFSIFNTSCNMFTDVMCATLPIPIIWALNMKLRTRIYLVIVLSLGYITVGMGAVKAYYQVGTKRSPDSQFTQDIQFYGFLQFNLGIIVACAPTLRPLLGRALKLSTADKSYGNNYYASGRSGNGQRRSTVPRKTDYESGGYELDEGSNGPFDKVSQIKTTVRGGDITIYDKSADDRSGSEEIILQTNEVRGGGILRTTQIEVR